MTAEAIWLVARPTPGIAIYESTQAIAVNNYIRYRNFGVADFIYEKDSV
jgi:hypothetical protein